MRSFKNLYFQTYLVLMSTKINKFAIIICLYSNAEKESRKTEKSEKSAEKL